VYGDNIMVNDNSTTIQDAMNAINERFDENFTDTGIRASAAEISGQLTAGSVEVNGNITGKFLTIAPGVSELKNTHIAGAATIDGAVTAGSATINGAATVNGLATLKNGAAVTGKVTAGSAEVSGAVTAGSATISGAATVNGLATLKNGAAVTGKVTAGSAEVSDLVVAGTATINTLNEVNTLRAVNAVLQSLTTQGATMNGVTTIEKIKTALIESKTSNHALLQWALGNLTIGNLDDQIKIMSKERLNAVDDVGPHQVAYLDDLVGNILFQFAVYSIGDSPTALPPINPAQPPSPLDKALVKNWDGTPGHENPAYVTWVNEQWVFDSFVNKPDDYAWEWVVKHYRSFEYQDYSTVFVIYSHAEDWSIIDLPLELYRPFAEQNIIDNNAKAWTRYANNFIPNWLVKRVPRRVTSQDMGIDGPGNATPDRDKSGFIKNKPPLLSDYYGMNVIDGGDETDEAFNQANWGDHTWGFLVDGGNEHFNKVFRYFIDGGNEKFLAFWYNRVYPTLHELAEA
jgi:hypothetical protein